MVSARSKGQAAVKGESADDAERRTGLGRAGGPLHGVNAAAATGRFYARGYLLLEGTAVSSYPETRDRRSTLGTLALAAAAISLAGIVIILVGIALDIEGAQEG